MNIYGMEKLSLVDYDGHIAATLFTGGCNFCCPFCHNKTLVIGYSNQPQLEEDEIFNYLKKRKNLLTGVCISGGEPTLQPDLKEFAKKIKDLDYKIKLDTNGTAPETVYDLIHNGLIDYVAMDIKNSKEKYCITAGAQNLNLNKIMESVEMLKSDLTDYEFRTTLIKEFHTKNDMENIGDWLKGAKKLFLQHFKSSSDCINPNLNEIPIDEAETFKSILQKNILSVSLRGY